MLETRNQDLEGWAGLVFRRLSQFYSGVQEHTCKASRWRPEGFEASQESRVRASEEGKEDWGTHSNAIVPVVGDSRVKDIMGLF